MRRNVIFSIGLGIAFGVVGFSCSRSSDESVTSSRKLYIATGLCYSGENFVPATINNVGQLLSRLDLSTLNYEVIHDYNDLSEEAPGSYANGMQDGGDGYIYVAVENATGSGTSQRRVDKILKAVGGARTTWSPASALVASTVRSISKAPDNGFLVGTTTGIERYDSSPQQITKFGGGSWGSGLPAAPANCSNNNTRITNIIALPASVTGDAYGKFIYSHAAAGENDIGIISKEGATLNSCLANAAGGSAMTAYASTATDYGVAGRTLEATATPVSMVYVPQSTAGTGKLLVAYSSYGDNTAGGGMFNGLVMYDVTQNTAAGETATISNGTILYNNQVYFYGVTSIAYDSATGYLYAASTPLANDDTPNGFTIEKFAVDLNTPSATRLTAADGTSSFQSPNTFNNCVTSMFVGD